MLEVVAARQERQGEEAGMNLELEGAVTLIAGASKGIGLACARAFAQAGARVVGVARDAGTLAEARQQMQRDGLAMAIEQADVGDEDAVLALVRRVEDTHGPISVLVCSAGAARRYLPEELCGEAFRQGMAAKYFTTMYLLDAVVRRMAARGRGSVVNIVGQGGRRATPHHIAGGAANAALMLATVGYARAWAAQGVRVNAINPGLTRTTRLEEGFEVRARASGRTPGEVLAEAVAAIPMGRLAEPCEIADLALFLASARASYITGAIIPMDGGTASVI